MYRAREQLENDRWIADIERGAKQLSLSSATVSRAVDLFLSTVPEDNRSKRACAAASLYAGALITGERRSQSAVADAMDVARLTVQQRWKTLIEDAGLKPPRW
ncbi:cyclin family protein [Halocatena halophila]|uniref:transcription initiation factor IIB family protein n=1 Tax=Halocatena halophila TaxID=2814576 RepID=UPI002ED39572